MSRDTWQALGIVRIKCACFMVGTFAGDMNDKMRKLFHDSFCRIFTIAALNVLRKTKYFLKKESPVQAVFFYTMGGKPHKHWTFRIFAIFFYGLTNLKISDIFINRCNKSVINYRYK